MSISSEEIYSTCLNADDQLQCITEYMVELHSIEIQGLEANRKFNRDTYLIFAAALVFMMQAGFAMVCAGAVRRKNLQNTMLKNLLDTCGASLAFYALGYGFAYGDGSSPNGFLGTTNFFLHGVEDLTLWIFQYTFAAASATIVAGALAERCQMNAYFLYSVVLSGWVYPIVVHAIWSPHGFLNPNNSTPLLGVGVLDFAGGMVVHGTGGMTALVATFILGPRRGRFHDAETGEPLDVPNMIPGHSVTLQMLGTLLLWFGWFGFNSGSAFVFDTEHHSALAALAAVNTTLAAAAGALTAMFANVIITERTLGARFYDLVLTMNGALSGLVAITAGCGFVESWAAVIIGCIAGLLYLLGSWLLVECRLDDAVDAVPVHLLSGIWGMIAVGLFASPDRIEQAYGVGDHPGLFYTIFGRQTRIDGSLLGAQLVGIFFVIGWCIAMMLPFFMILEWWGLFRSNALDEVAGLDKSFHGGEEVALRPADLAAFETRMKTALQSSTSAPLSEVHMETSSRSTRGYRLGSKEGSINMDLGGPPKL